MTYKTVTSRPKKKVTVTSRLQTRPTYSDEGPAYQFRVRVITSWRVISYFTRRGAPRDKGARISIFIPRKLTLDTQVCGSQIQQQTGN